MSDKGKTKILIVDDEMIVAADISTRYTNMGYEVIGIYTSAEDALKTIDTHRPDIILIDVHIKGTIDGISAALIIFENHRIPVIFITSNPDEETFKRAIATRPYAFITTPYTNEDLKQGIDLTMNRMNSEKEHNTEDSDHHLAIMDDRLFIHHKHRLVKVSYKDILYVEANRNYCTIQTPEVKYLLTIPLGTVESILPRNQFVRVHRSYVANLFLVEEISELVEELTIKNFKIPVSRRMREHVIKRINMI
ncbi:MAG: response regulator [Saprospiraceae bacterium]|nr:LytTR family transcriptional regulator DNA-binding domain-containing protein [Bacteroidia bacterium]NNF21195.1 response regulator [Saprospiraceae bacterium]